jgi:hypothetical protein
MCASDTALWAGRGVAAIVIAGGLTALTTGSALVISMDAAGATQSTEASVPEVAEFQKRAQEYVALHKKVEGGITPLPNEATPEQIDGALVQLSQGIVKARAAAKVGDIFQPAMQAWVRKTLQRAFSGPDGKDLRASILDENPIGATVRVNGPYPDSIPLSTMPPKVIEALPKLPEELEFRFVGDRLILFDHHAHIIVDYVDRALPMV